MASPADVANVLRSATANAGAIEAANQQARAADAEAAEASAFDVWTHTGRGLQERATDPSAQGDPDRAMVEGLAGDWAAASPDGVGESMSAQAGDAWGQFQLLTGMREPGPGEAAPQGVLGTVGATFGLLTGLEQMISAPLSMIPFPAFPAIRVMDMDVGLPHAHSHPPNLVPPAPPVPLPSTGPIIPIPLLSGAAKTLINGMPAARCGDMGLGIWCGGYFPMYEVFLGSSSVWIEGARAGRLLVDITKHCIFTSPRPSDPPLGPMVGMTISSSGNVLIGGVPMPSLLNLALGAAMRGLFAGLGRVARRLRAARAARAASRTADDVAIAASRASSRASAGFSRAAVRIFWRRFVLDVRRLIRRLSPRARGIGKVTLQTYVRAGRIVDDLLDSGAIAIRSSDDAFVEGVKRDLRRIACTRTGREVLADMRINRIRHGTSTTIEELPSGQGAHAEYNTSARYDYQNGQPGAPSDSTIRYRPGHEDPYSPGTTSDATLLHEATHARNAGRGEMNDHVQLSDEAEAARWTNAEEQSTIATENAYRRERGLPERDGHDDLP